MIELTEEAVKAFYDPANDNMTIEEFRKRYPRKIDMNFRRAEHDEPTCDDCDSQEGRHYCLLHGIQVKNMDLMRCGDFEWKEDDQ